MREIQASEVKVHLTQIMPEPARWQEKIDQAIRAIRELQKRAGRVTVEELCSTRHEGHKY